MKGKAVTWFKGLSTSGKVVLTACVLTFVAIIGAGATAPEVTTKTITEKEAIAYTTNYQEDENLLATQSQILTPGVEGQKEVTYKVTYTGDKETKRDKLNEKVLSEPTPALAAKGVKEVKTETVKEAIAYTSNTKSDFTMTKGTRKTLATGVNGERTVTYQITKIRGKEVSRTQVKAEVTVQPINEVIAVGAKSAATERSSSSCHPSYSGACVPIASDVDCGSGSGNGPAYVYSTVRVIGADVYGLDADGDGYGCE